MVSSHHLASFFLEEVFSSWSVQELFTKLSTALTACFKSECKVQEGQSLCSPLTQGILAPCSAAFAIVICRSSSSCSWQCTWWPYTVTSVHEVHKWNSSHPPSPSRTLKWLCWYWFSVQKPFPPTSKDFLTHLLKDVLTIVIVYLPVTNQLLSCATW